MAIFYFQASVVQRSKGRSAVAAAAYRAGTKLKDERTGLVFDYTDKENVDGVFLVGWSGGREQLWNAVEAAEKRRNSTVAREYILALPRELNANESQTLAIELAKTINMRYGVAVDLCFHGANTNNPHVHLLTTTREICPIYNELGPKSIVDISNTARKNKSLPGYKEQLDSLKRSWCNLVNDALKRNGFDDEISHLSFKKRGILNRTPQIKTYGNPQRVAVNKAIKEHNRLKDEIEILHHEIYLEDFELEQDYQHYLEQIEPPTPEPINLLQPDHVVFEQHGEDDFSASERLMAEFETEWAAEDAAIEAAKKAQSEKEKMSQTSIDMKTAPMEANERFYKQSVMGLGPN